MVEAVGLQIFRQIGIDQPDLAALDRGVTVLDIGLALAQRLDLGAGQHKAGLHGIEHLIGKPRLAVFRNGLVVGIGFSDLIHDVERWRLIPN